MSESVSIVLLAGALCTALCVVGGAAMWLVSPRIAEWVGAIVDKRLAETVEKVDATHKTLTQNSHQNADPTVLDRLEDWKSEVLGGVNEVRDGVNEVRDDLSAHILLDQQNQAALRRQIADHTH